jgi:hypothetical protein
MRQKLFDLWHARMLVSRQTCGAKWVVCRVNGHHGRTQRTQRFNAKAPSCSRNMCGSASAPLVYWNLLSYLVVQKRLIFRLRSCANALILHLLLQWGQS